MEQLPYCPPVKSSHVSATGLGVCLEGLQFTKYNDSEHNPYYIVILFTSSCMLHRHTSLIIIIGNSVMLILMTYRKKSYCIPMADDSDRFRSYFLEIIPWNHSGTTPFLMTQSSWNSVNQARAVSCLPCDCVPSIHNCVL